MNKLFNNFKNVKLDEWKKKINQESDENNHYNNHDSFVLFQLLDTHVCYVTRNN